MSRTSSGPNAFVKRSLAALFVTAFLAGCATTLSKTGAILPDERVPHRVAEEAVIWVWARNDKGELVKTKIRLMPGWWVASPRVVEP